MKPKFAVPVHHDVSGLVPKMATHRGITWKFWLAFISWNFCQIKKDQLSLANHFNTVRTSSKQINHGMIGHRERVKRIIPYLEKDCSYYWNIWLDPASGNQSDPCPLKWVSGRKLQYSGTGGSPKRSLHWMFTVSSRSDLRWFSSLMISPGGLEI